MITFQYDLAKERGGDYKTCKLPFDSLTVTQGVEILEKIDG